MDKITFKIPFFLILLIFGGLVSGGDWLLGGVCATLILFILEIGLAYDKGKKDGRQEYLEEERLNKQAKQIRKMEKKEEKEPEKNKNMIKDIKCSKCSVVFFPFRKDFKCPNCGEPTNEFFEAIPDLVNLLENNKKKYGKYRPDNWEAEYFLDNMLRYTAELFDMIKEKNFNDPEDFIKYYFNRAREDGKEKYMADHFEDFALAIAVEIRERTEKKQIEKLKNAKTGGGPITIDESYGAIGPDGKDDGWRFVRKKDAEEHSRRLNQ